MQSCDLFVELVGDEGSKGGRHCELGLAVGWDKKIILIGGLDCCIFTNLPWLARMKTIIKERETNVGGIPNGES